LFFSNRVRLHRGGKEAQTLEEPPKSSIFANRKGEEGNHKIKRKLGK